MARVRARMDELGVDALLLSLGADLPWLTGYTAMPLERLTMLVLPADGDADARRPPARGPAGRASGPTSSRCARGPRPRTRWRSWPSLVGARSSLAVSDRTWATFVLAAAGPAARGDVAGGRRASRRRCAP